MSDDRKDLPPASAPNFNERLRETLQTYLGTRGNKLDRGVTLRDLSDAKLIALDKGFLAGTGGRGSPIAGAGTAVTGAYEVDLTPPPTPTGFVVSAAISNIIIECAAPLYPQGHGHAKTVVYGATWTSGALPTFADAVKITEFSGTVFSHPTNPATTWRLWIKWQSVDGVLSAAPAGGTNGLAATTGQDVSTLLGALSGKLTESQLNSALGTRIALIDAPGSTAGSVNSRLAQESATRAQALLDEAAARSSSVAALQSQIDTVVAVAGGDLSSVIAAVQTEQTARANADSAEAASRETLAVQMRGSYTGTDAAAVTTGLLYSERTARISAMDAEVSSRNAAIASSIASTTATQAAINAALSGATDTERTARIASVTQETNARISAVNAEAADRLALAAIVAGNVAAISAEQTARANADSAEAAARTSLTALFQGATLIYNGSFAGNSAEGWASLTGTTAVSGNDLPKPFAGKQCGRDAMFPDADPNLWFPCAPGEEFEVSAWAYAPQTSPTFTIGVQYQTTSGNTEHWVGVASCEAPTGARQLKGYWTVPAEARRVRFWSQINTFGTENPWYFTDVQMRRTDARTGANSAAITAEQTARANAITAEANARLTLQSVVDGNSAAISTEATTRATQTGNLFAQYTVKVDVNGYVAGYGLASTVVNGTPSSEFIIRADNFAIAPVNTDNTAADGSPFFYRTTATTINGVSVPAGAYMKAAFIHDATITNAKIANLAVDDAKIANLSVSKLTAGSLAVGQYAQSTSYVAGSAGWRINGDGTAEFSNVTVRGTVYAAAGQIGGCDLDSQAIKSNNWNGSIGPTGAGWAIVKDGNSYFNNINIRGQINTGNYTGYGWPASGGGAHLSASGLLVGNYNLGKYFQLTSDGNLYAPQLNIVNGTATFGGALSAASGTFAGELSAATGTFSGALTASAINAVNTINIAGDAVSIMLNTSESTSNVSLTVTVPSGHSYKVLALGFTGYTTVVGFNTSLPPYVDLDGVSAAVPYNWGSSGGGSGGGVSTTTGYFYSTMVVKPEEITTSKTYTFSNSGGSSVKKTLILFVTKK